MQQQPRQTQRAENAGSFRQKMEQLEWLTKFPAMTLMVILRQDIGFRFLNPIAVVASTAIVLAFAWLFRVNPRSEDLVAFAGIPLFAGFAQRLKRGREIEQGVQQHTYYIGTSCLEFRWLPKFFHRNRRVARFVDPICCVLVGFALYHLTPVLAAWLIFAGLCLRTFEAAVYRREFNRALDTLDGMVNSEIQGDTVEHFSESPGRDQQTEQNSKGLPTGLGKDIQHRIKRKP